MIEESIKEYMEKITIKSKEISIYTNEEKGLMYPLNTGNLLCRVDYLEMGKEELQKAIFEQKVDKKEYQMYDCEKMIPKSDVTKDKKDLFTLTKKTFKGTHIWNVTNQVGIHSSFENKEEAFKLCQEINDKVIENLK